MQENKIMITWYGTASVRITAGDSQVLIDPFFPFDDSKVRVARDAYDGCSNILISHGHFDHTGSINEIACEGTMVYCSRTPYHNLCRKGVGKEKLHLISQGSVFSIGDLRITAYKGKHIKLTATDCLKKVFSKRAFQNRKGIMRKLLKIVSCPEKKETLCYLIEAYGKKIMILGSLALAEDTDYPKGVDLALFPFQGCGDMCGPAIEVYEHLKPKAVLLTHFDDTFPPFSTEVDTSGFEALMNERAVVYKLRHGGSTEI